MKPTYTAKPNGRRFRYYISSSTGESEELPPTRKERISAKALELLVREALLCLRLPAGERASPVIATSFIERINVCPPHVHIHLDKEAALKWWIENTLYSDCMAEEELLSLYAKELPSGAHIKNSKKELILTFSGLSEFQKANTLISSLTKRPPATLDIKLIRAVARALRWRKLLENGEIRSVQALAKKVGQERRHVRRTLSLAFLSPDLMEGILNGKQPKKLTLSKLLYDGVPHSWILQRKAILADST